MGWAWFAFGAVVLGFGGDALRHIVVRRPSGRQVAEALRGPGSNDLSPAFEDRQRSARGDVVSPPKYEKQAN